jgi:uncharacterized protein involved in copper resistance
MTKYWKPALLCVAAASVMTLAACGEKQTMASKSAAAYREAQTKAVPVAGGHDHGQHTAKSPMDHPTMDHSTMTGMDHSTMDHSTTTMDHSKMGHSTVDHSTMDHSKMDHSKPDHSTMDHSSAHPATVNHPPAHTGHTAAPGHAATPDVHRHSTPAPATAVTVAPRSGTDVHRVDPAATLRPDDFDAPAASAVEEAQKASGDPHAGHVMPPAKKERR